MMYNTEKSLQFFEDQNNSHDEKPQEPWMLADVEEEFRKLTLNCSQPYDLYNGFKPVDCVEVEESIQQKYPVLAKKCQPHAIGKYLGYAEETLETIYLPNPFYRIDDLNQLELQMRITSTKHIWENPIKNVMHFINAQKYIHQLRCPPFSEVQYTTTEKSNTLRTDSTLAFPPNTPSSSASLSGPSPNPFASSFHLVESIGDLNVRQTLRTSSRTSPSTENKTETSSSAVARKRSSDGRDFTNLSLLTRQYTYCLFLNEFFYFCKKLFIYLFIRSINRRELSIPEHSSLQVPDTVLKWLQTGYPTRSKEFSAIQNLSEELRTVRCALQSCNVSSTIRNRSAKYVDESFPEKKCEFFMGKNANYNRLIHQNENLSASFSSSSSSEQNRSSNSKSGTKLQISSFPKLSYSAVTSGGSPTAWQVQTSSFWSSKPFNLLGSTTATAAATTTTTTTTATSCNTNLIRDYATNSYDSKSKYRPILNAQYRELSDEESFNYGSTSEKKGIPEGMGNVRLFDSLEDNAFDDLERQAIAQWPSEDNLDIFQSRRVQLIVGLRRMTTKFRHPQVASLRAINSSKSIHHSLKSSDSPKKKSAVQMLQETKAFYVKSEISSNISFSGQNNFGQTTCFQHKSLPDLHVSPEYSSDESSNSSFNIEYNGDSRSVYSTLTGSMRHKNHGKNIDNRGRCLKSNIDCKNYLCRNHSKWFASFHMTNNGGEFSSSKGIQIQSSCQRRSSYTSSCNRSRHNSSSMYSQSADSGRQSQGGSIGLRTGRSGLPEYNSSPKSSWSDSGTEDDFPSPCRKLSFFSVKKKPILRSKSDISHKYCSNKVKPVLSISIQPSTVATDKLENFFNNLGMDPADYKELASNNSGKTSPVYFSSVSSVDSCVDVAIWNVPETFKATECLSIVERNARIVKWLYNCLLPVTGKFYAWHDAPDPNFQDPLIEKAIYEKKNLLPRDKYKEPITTSME
ncbi:conserved hypothetical protein [Pediculus humanus corporis]|uniref:Centrosome-associated FAM110 C-terminal domain-containing protein n=1 Tax=Pediculus humanus subsp. corporis TaxID=121224 RepID=E0VHA6_PEDHC|nr:uncharacterized protein Phum_PHUM204420 [Pediculus humanus corporis]EEB12762.1 conserved hypothetical protein [Pediculus humanus corporis]